MTGRMLCSGTGGPPKRGENRMVCPVCGRDTFGDPTGDVVPRHFITTGGTS